MYLVVENVGSKEARMFHVSGMGFITSHVFFPACASWLLAVASLLPNRRCHSSPGVLLMSVSNHLHFSQASQEKANRPTAWESVLLPGLATAWNLLMQVLFHTPAVWLLSCYAACFQMTDGYGLFQTVELPEFVVLNWTFQVWFLFSLKVKGYNVLEGLGIQQWRM